MDHAPGAPRYDGHLLNPADYQSHMPKMQPVPQHKDQYMDQVVVTSVLSCDFDRSSCCCDTPTLSLQVLLVMQCYWQNGTVVFVKGQGEVDACTEWLLIP